MSEPTTLLTTVTSLHTSTQAARSSLPNATSLRPPASGVSLLDAKSEIFLSYLQALALRNLHVIRSFRDGASVEDVLALSDEITAKLAEHRVYLERGVRPLEQKMKYQIERAVHLAGEEERGAVRREKQMKSKNSVEDGDGEGVDSGSSSDDSDDEGDAHTSNANATAFRPGTFAAPQTPADSARNFRSRDGAVYRPPRISATSMPTTESHDSKPTKPARSRTLDEYISTELSAAPAAEPSIGSTIAASGRRTKNTQEVAREKERRDYEETHLMRLPPESKKERAKQKARERRSGFGGEEWQGLGESADRIGEVTRRRKVGVLERSRKRATEDGPRGSGADAGAAFEVKRRRVEKKGRR